jgi:hypothetical protein
VTSKKNLDQQRIDEYNASLAELERLTEVGDEDGYVLLIKKLRPQISKAELLAFIGDFRETRRQRSS